MCPPCLIPAFIIIIILWIVYTINPGIIPSSWWRNKYVRAFSRANGSVVEKLVGNPNMVSQPVMSYYKTFEKEKYGKNAIVVGFHYTNWCGYCKLMKPIWEQLKNNLSTDEYSGITMIENDEQRAPTPGIDVYPTIIKYRGGVARKYEGRADYHQLREWILSPFQVDTYGSHW